MNLPGRQLRAAREARGISRTWVAYQLNLTTDRLAALEDDDYTGLPESAYLRGYWRAYAQLVGLDWEDVETPEQIAAPWHDQHVEHSAVRPGRQLLFVALLLMMIGILVWQWQRELFAEPVQQTLNQLTLPEPPAPNPVDPERDPQ